MPVSDEFAKLKGQVEEAERTIREAAAEDHAKAETKIDEARQKADAHAAEQRDKPQEADDRDDGWQKIRSDWDRHVQRTRERIDAKKASVEASDAEHDAEWAEADAYDAIDFAASAILEAQYLVLDAVGTRKKADAVAARQQ
jgi:Tfp pilus assembly protein PilX